MKSLAEILPDVPKKTRSRYAKLLREVGLIASVEDLAAGKVPTYTETEAEALTRFSDALRVQRLTTEEALAVLKGAQAPSRPTGSEGLKPPQGPDPAAELRAALETIRIDFQAEKEAREREARELENQLRKERAEMAEVIERERVERMRTESQVRDLDEERRNQRARISILEDNIKKGRPRTWRDRFRAAWRVLVHGHDVAVVGLLPAPRDDREERAA